MADALMVDGRWPVVDGPSAIIHRPSSIGHGPGFDAAFRAYSLAFFISSLKADSELYRSRSTPA
jgi:hypothetical protein